MENGERNKVMLETMKRAIAAFLQNVEQGNYTIGEMAMRYYCLMHACNNVKESFGMDRKS